MGEPLTIESNVERLRTDAVVATEVRAELAPLLDKVCAVIARARADGLVVNFTIGQDQFGRTRVGELTIVKPL